MASEKILVVEDEGAVRDMVRELLEGAGYTVVDAANGIEGLRQFFNERPDLAMLDILMPKMDGIELCQRIREVSSIPIIILSAKGEEMDKVRGLTAGADDYMAKPLGSKELVARVEAALRRAHSQGPQEAMKVYSDGEVTIDYQRHEVSVRGKKVNLTRLEYRLLTTLVGHVGQVLTHEQLLEKVWGPNYDSQESIKWHIGHLRQKVEKDQDAPGLIITVRGIGYRYDAPRRP